MSANRASGVGGSDDVVVRKAERGWVVGDENVSDLTSAMVLADLFAADQADSDDTTVMEAVDERGAPRRPRNASAPAPRSNDSGPQRQIPAVSGAAGIADRSVEVGEAERLAVTVAQLEHALAARVRVEQAIGVLAERHRLRPREAFDLLRKASRSRGRRVIDIAEEVVASASNSLLRLPEELERKREPRAQIRAARRSRPHR